MTRRASSDGLLEGVLDVVARLLEVGLGLVGLALGLEALVVLRLARALLDLALRLFGGVLDLVTESHGISSRRYLSTVGTTSRARTSMPSVRPVMGCPRA